MPQLLRAVGVEEDFVISGGISKNVGVVRRVEQKLGTRSHICFEPQVVGALGAALFAREFLAGKAYRRDSTKDWTLTFSCSIEPGVASASSLRWGSFHRSNRSFRMAYSNA